MNKYLRIFGMIIVLCFSFYCAEQTALFMQKKDPLYETILAVKEDYKKSSIDASIDGNYIIPGVVGLEVDLEKSFRNMKYVGAFQASQLVFEEVKPNVSLAENKNKIIKQGNPFKQGVSLIVMDENLIFYLEEMGIPYAVLTTQKNVDKHRAYGMKINYDFNAYDKLEQQLVSQKENNNFCFVSENKESFCESKNKLLIEESKSISQSNYGSTWDKIVSGDILYLQNNLGITNLKLLLEQIRFKGLLVLSLSELLTESR